MKKAGLERSLSIEEIGNPVNSPEWRRLFKLGIDCIGKIARQLIRASYGEYDLLIGIDWVNLCNMCHICGDSLDCTTRLLLEITDHASDVANPSYTGGFEVEQQDVSEECAELLEAVVEEVRWMCCRILCYGDSNTYGYDPRPYWGGRYPQSVHWTGLLEATVQEVCRTKAEALFVMLEPNDLLQHLASVQRCAMAGWSFS